MMGDFVGAVIQPKPIPRTEVMALFLVQDIMFAERAGPIRTKTADTAILLGGPARRLDGRTDRRSEAKQERQTRKMFQSYVVFKHRGTRQHGKQPRPEENHSPFAAYGL
jgi:hypothetical protein